MRYTQSVGGVVLRNDLILVVSQHGTSCSLPKGHVEEGEDKIETAKREIYEETGLTDLQFIKELGSYQRYRLDEKGNEDKNKLKTIFMLLFYTNEKKLNPVDSENPEAKWIKKEKVVALLTHEKDREFYLSVMNELK